MKQLTIEEIKEKAVPILKNAGITKSAIFGSYVRGDAGKTGDIDFLVAFPEKATLLDFVRLRRTLENNFQKRVDIASYNAISPLMKNSIFQHLYQLI